MKFATRKSLRLAERAWKTRLAEQSKYRAMEHRSSIQTLRVWFKLGNVVGGRFFTDGERGPIGRSKSRWSAVARAGNERLSQGKNGFAAALP